MCCFIKGGPFNDNVLSVYQTWSALYIGHFTFNLGPSIQLAALSKTGLQPIRTVQIKNKIVAHPVNTPTMPFLAFLSTNYHHFPSFFDPINQVWNPHTFSLEFHVFSCFSIGFYDFVMFVGLIGPYWNIWGFHTCFSLEFHVFHVFSCFFHVFSFFSCFFHFFILEFMGISYLFFNGRYRASLFMFFHVCACIFMFVDLLVYCLKTSFFTSEKTVFSLITLTKIN